MSQQIFVNFIQVENTNFFAFWTLGLQAKATLFCFRECEIRKSQKILTPVNNKLFDYSWATGTIIKTRGNKKKIKKFKIIGNLFLKKRRCGRNFHHGVYSNFDFILYEIIAPCFYYCSSSPEIVELFRILRLSGV